MGPTNPTIGEDVLAYYATGVELDRLETGVGVLERARTQEILESVLGSRQRVLDVGGATGTYASWLVSRGHDVTLVEPVPAHLDEARRIAGESPAFQVVEGDARSLEADDDSFDAVLLLGPLYHLVDRADRIDALREASRVSRTGGTVVAAAISRFASLLGGLTLGFLAEERSFANIRDELRSGRRVEATRRTRSFPDAYFHFPEELESELEEAGLVVESLVGVEGPGWLVQPFSEAWADEVMRERILWAARTTESDPRLRAVSAHLLAVARVS